MWLFRGYRYFFPPRLPYFRSLEFVAIVGADVLLNVPTNGVSRIDLAFLIKIECQAFRRWEQLSEKLSLTVESALRKRDRSFSTTYCCGYVAPAVVGIRYRINRPSFENAFLFGYLMILALNVDRIPLVSRPCAVTFTETPIDAKPFSSSPGLDRYDDCNGDLMTVEKVERSTVHSFDGCLPEIARTR
ncbi:hypothetical protein CLF_109965 [Clonorchis sinensis]|uniref:Uncharacterized protein n=1 Tax=Clonorchis sinensis TaxID=79923 RepID=G7YK22_CLOSI|nr:hypothetical protein CLF_109965 [Clonorchis sinensis]